MLLQLVVKYFFLNRKRTYRAIGILSIGIIIIMSTNMILGGYLEEVTEFSNILDRSNRSFVIYNSKSNTEVIPQEAYQEAISILRTFSGIEYFLPKFEYPVELSVNNRYLGYFQLLISNTSKMIHQGLINLSGDNISESLAINNKLDLSTDLEGIPYEIKIMNHTISTDYASTMITTSDIGTDLVLNYNSSLIPKDLVNKWNSISILLTESAISDELARQINHIRGIRFEENRPDKTFLLESSKQIGNLLIIFQFSMSILLILSITYVMLALIQDSSKDIRLMKMIGLSKIELMSVYLGQTMLIGLFSCIFSLLVSVLFLNFLFAALSLSPLFPYNTIVVELRIVVISFLQSIFVSIIAGIYPAYKVIK